ncbi:MAG: glutamate--tRNA ligase family protein, partial [Pseudomonadota bacterium]
MVYTTRFAPSPTGYLHVGGARTALFCWLQAQKEQGRFVLRIEDTDRQRSTDEAVEAILDGMQWLGLDADEAPVFQTDRFERYAEVVRQLVDGGHAYPCYCSAEELESMREAQRNRGEKPKYDGRCLHRQSPPSDVPVAIRFRSPTTGNTRFTDLIRGELMVDNSEIDDLIIQR